MNPIAQLMRQINRAVRTMISLDRTRCLNGENEGTAWMLLNRCPFDWGSTMLLVTPQGDYWQMLRLGLN